MFIEGRHPDIRPILGQGSAIVATSIACLSERVPAVLRSPPLVVDGQLPSQQVRIAACHLVSPATSDPTGANF